MGGDHQPSTSTDHPTELVQTCLRRGPQMQVVHRDDDVEGSGGTAGVLRGPGKQLHPIRDGAAPPSRGPQHQWGRVDPDHLGTELGGLPDGHPGPAPDDQNMITRADLAELDGTALGLSVPPSHEQAADGAEDASRVSEHTMDDRCHTRILSIGVDLQDGCCGREG